MYELVLVLLGVTETEEVERGDMEEEVTFSVGGIILYLYPSLLCSNGLAHITYMLF